MPAARLAATLRRLGADARGAMGMFGLYCFACMAAVGGLAIDVSHVHAERVRLQLAADAAAHAALVARRKMPAEAAKQQAIAVAAPILDGRGGGKALQPADIAFGRFDRATGSFTADPAATGSVRVSTARLEARGNAVASFVSSIIGVDSWSISREAVFEAFSPGCAEQGFLAEGPIDVQSNNAYLNGFCLHSNTWVSINSNNSFTPGTVLSMPDMTLLDMPASGFANNPGLQAALRPREVEIRELRDLAAIIDQIQTLGSWHTPDYVTSGTVIQLKGTSFDPSHFTAGRIHRITDCAGKVTIATKALATTVRKAVIVTDCAVSLGSGLAFEDAVLATRDVGAKSVTGASGVRLGRVDACQPGGGAQVLTLGSADLPSGFNLHGSQVIARGDITFSSNANGVGLSLIAGGRIDGTSNMTMTRCRDGMAGNFKVDHYRLAL